jgi:endonuclease-8
VPRFLSRLRADDLARTIGDALLDRHTVAGIGNLWKTETCFAVDIDPWRPLAQLRDEEAAALVAFAREHMRESAHEGLHARPHARPHAVYKRAGRPCVRYGSRIRQRAHGDHNRLTFWCPGCQR